MNPTTDQRTDHGPRTIDPCADGIRPHQCIKHIPLWPDNGPRMEALRGELQASGLCQPVQMTAKHEIVDADSRERWRAARMLQLDSIPIAIVPEDQATSACANALAHRRHLTKSAIAYLLFPLVERLLDEARHRALEMLKKGNDFPSGAPCRTGNSREDICHRLGVGDTLLKEARRVHELFAKDPSFKAQMEPRILAEPIGGEHEQHRPVGLGSVIAGYAGRNENGIEKKGQLELFTGGFGTFVKRFLYWTGFDPAARRAALQQMRKDLDALPPEQQEELAELFRTIAREASARGGAK